MKPCLFLGHRSRRTVSSRSRTPARVRQTDTLSVDEQWQQTITLLSEQFKPLHLWVLKRNLCLLADPLTSDGQRRDIMAWVRQPHKPALKPFSLHTCLLLYDRRCDIETVQQRLEVLNRQVVSVRQAFVKQGALWAGR